MVATPEQSFPDHGDPNSWATLDAEELRCLEGLRSYYVKIEDKQPHVGLELAWVDLKREFPRLKAFNWYAV